MRILSMTATFGKLEHETLTLEPGLNILEAPNEWGKSTWCAFLEAMLYGIDSGERDTKTSLAAKNRFAPWSGSPMSGRMDLLWNGRAITIERSSKGRNLMRQFRAYETDSGLEVPELTAENCGQTLLGVERSVFLRSALLRLSDLPVTQDEALRTRLNALVTTGDESGTANALAQKLRELKNRCRANRSNGLLPQALEEQAQLESKLRELRELQSQYTQLQTRQAQLEEHRQQLMNHQAALDFAEAHSRREKQAAAQAARELAAQKTAELEAACQDLPEGDAEQKLAALRHLREERDSLQLEAQLLPQEPQKPEIPERFRDFTPEGARTDVQVYEEACRERQKKLLGIWGLAVAILGLALLLIPHWIGKAVGIAGVLTGIALWQINRTSRRRAAATAKALSDQYASLPPEEWEGTVRDHLQTQKDYEARREAWAKEREELETRSAALKQQIAALTEGKGLADYERQWVAVGERRQALADARRELRRREELVQALEGPHKELLPPQFPDTLTYSPSDTARLLSDCGFELRELQRKLGHCQGRMEALGTEEPLMKALEAVRQRIQKLELTMEALTLAQETLAQATLDLQRRFAPRISQQAQSLMARMTGGRYDRLSLGEDFTVHTGAQAENTLHTALWRSDGTTDQLYLALRLAVARELTPQAPLILDDALVRFDDTRLKAALAILEEEAQSRQVLLFTCQTREKICLQSL